MFRSFGKRIVKVDVFVKEASTSAIHLPEAKIYDS